MNYEYKAKFEECYRHYYKKITRYIIKKIQNIETAEEIAQEIFTSLYEKEKPLDINSPTTSAFLYRIAKNRIIDFYRKRLQAIPLSHTLEEIIYDESFCSQIADCVCEGEVVDTIDGVLNRIPNLSKEIFVRRVIQKTNISQICSELKISRYLINKTVQDVRLTLKESLAKYHLSF